MENPKTTFRPILFSTPMVQALLEGRKTMTRRVVKPQPESIDFYEDRNVWFPEVSKCPYEVGDVLWVRETFSAGCIENGKHTGIRYKADDSNYPVKWKPSLFMPKHACRIFLKVKSIRVERLQDISEEDAIAEGVESRDGRWKDYFLNNQEIVFHKRTAKRSFNSLWSIINGIDSFLSNSFVWVYEFERIEKPLDFIV